MNSDLLPVVGSTSAGRPTIVLGGSSMPFGSTRSAVHTAVRGLFYAMDLDIRSSWLSPSWKHVAGDARHTTIRLRSLWLPDAITGIALNRRGERLRSLLEHGRDELGLRELILPRLSGDTPGFSVTKFARTLARESPGVMHVAIGIHAESIMRHADHLDRISSIRRTVEEWDLRVALDLTGNVPIGWEAEAAIAKLSPRLSVVRLDPWLLPDGRPDMSTQGQIAARSVSMLQDQGFTGIISLHSRGGGLLGKLQVEKTSNLSELLYQDIMSRYTRAGADAYIQIRDAQRHSSPDLPS